MGKPVYASTSSVPQTPINNELLLDPRHTGLNNLCEFLFLMHLGALQWQAIAQHAGMRLSKLRSEDQKPVYASFYYIKEEFSVEQPMSAYGIDDRLKILSDLRVFGGTLIDGQHQISGEEKGPRHRGQVAHHPSAGVRRFRVRMANVFVKMRTGPDDLKVTVPMNLEFDHFPQATSRFSTYEWVRAVRSHGTFPLPMDRCAEPLGTARFCSPINPDRDINGVGLVYFANYVTFLDVAERQLLRQIFPALADQERIDRRALVEREIAYYGNARSHDSIEVETSAYLLGAKPADPVQTCLIRFDYRVHRRSDGKLICISSATKALPL